MDFVVSSVTDKRTPVCGSRPALWHPVVSSKLRLRHLYSLLQVSISRCCRRRSARPKAMPPQLQNSQLSKRAVNVIPVSPFVSSVVVPASAGVVLREADTVCIETPE